MRELVLVAFADLYGVEFVVALQDITAISVHPDHDVEKNNPCEMPAFLQLRSYGRPIYLSRATGDALRKEWMTWAEQKGLWL